MSKKNISTDQLISTIIKGIEDVKGEEIQLLDLREIENTVCDYFIVCSGNSNTQVKALSGAIQKVVGKEAQEKAWHVEGESVAEWVLIDYVNVVFTFSKSTSEIFMTSKAFGAMPRLLKSLLQFNSFLSRFKKWLLVKTPNPKVISRILTSNLNLIFIGFTEVCLCSFLYFNTSTVTIWCNAKFHKTNLKPF
jgi:ribosome-associated protein